MKSCFYLLLIFTAVLALQQDAAPSRIFKERVRTQTDEITENLSKQNDNQLNNEGDPQVIGSLDSIASFARVQKDQAETFRLWSSQFQQFKNTVLKFMEQTSDVLQKNEKKIKTLQRVVRKIARDIDE